MLKQNWWNKETNQLLLSSEGFEQEHIAFNLKGHEQISIEKELYKYTDCFLP